jgi:hypothetical protein
VEELFVQSELVAKVAWGDEPVAVVGESIEAIGAAQNRLDLALLEAAHSFGCRGEHRAEGHVSVVGYLKSHLGLKTSKAQRIARLGRFVADHPAIVAGMRAGHVSLDHVELLADGYQAEHAAAWDEIIPLIVDYVDGSRFADVARHVQATVDRFAPKKAEERFRKQIEDRSVSFTTTIDAMGYGRLWLEPFAAQTFGTELERLYQALFHQDWALAKETLGRDPDPKELADLTRTPAQRRHDALVEMARRSKNAAGGTTETSYCVVLHTTWDTYQAALRHEVTGEDLVVPDGGFCETDDGDPISPVAAVYASLEGHVRRLVFGADDEILSYGRARRIFPDQIASAIRAKYRRCCHPFGCDCRGLRLQTDHLHEWVDGGPTDVDNAQPLHDSHNRWKTHHKHDPPRPGRRDTGQRRGPPPWL